MLKGVYSTHIDFEDLKKSIMGRVWTEVFLSIRQYLGEYRCGRHDWKTPITVWRQASEIDKKSLQNGTY